MKKYNHFNYILSDRITKQNSKEKNSDLGKPANKFS